MKKIYFAFISFILPFAAKAGGDYGLTETAGAAKIGTQELPQRLGYVINGVFGLSGLIFLVLAIYGGFRIFLSAGDPENYKKGRDVILWGVIGMVIITLAYSLTRFIFNQFLVGGA